MFHIRRKTRRVRHFLSLAILTATSAGSMAFGQVPGQGPFDAKPAAPAVPSAAPAPAPAVVGTAREVELEGRLKQMESMVDRLSKQVDQLSTTGTRSGAGGVAGPDRGPGSGSIGTPSASGGNSAPGQSLPPNPSSGPRFQKPATLDNKPAKAKFGPGFEIRSDDDEYIFQFHNLTQIDYRGYQQGGQNPTHDTFGIPRQWFMFSGRLTQPIGYFVSLANGFDTLSALDVFIDFSYTPKFQIRAGRMKTPFTYEFLVEPIQGLLSPERSLFFNNFAQNRDVGVMAFGRVFDKKIDYAVGIYNGSRNGFLAQSDGKAISAFINYKPFNGEEGTLFENFNVGGSVFAVKSFSGLDNPQVLRTIVPTAGNQILGVPFLAFNSNTRESGYKAFWDLHMAWFYQQLSVIAEWGSGGQEYAPVTQLSNRTRVPVSSFYVQSGYLLTGETTSGTGLVKPFHPFDLRKDKFGMGAWELISRFQMMEIGNNVFTSGLADPNLWTNHLWMSDLGFNWHLTQYVKVMFQWEHAEFGSPVQYSPGKRQLTSDMFMLRCQLYF